jgi:hypothetical protein
MSVGNEYMLKVTRKRFPPNKTYSVKIKVNGYLHTEFALDGLLQDQIEKTIRIRVEEKRIIVVKSNEIQTLSKITDKWVVRPLAQTYEEVQQTSNVGFIEAGRYVALKFDLNVSRSKITDTKLYIDSKEIKDKVIYNNINIRTNIFAISFKVPDKLSTTLYGWYSLRKMTGNYFKVNPLDILSRKNTAHILKLKYKYKGKDYEETLKFDTLDNYMMNLNEALKVGVANINSLKEKRDLKDWLKE